MRLKPYFIINIARQKDGTLIAYIYIFDVYYSMFRLLDKPEYLDPDFIIWAITFDKIHLRKYVFFNGEYKGVIF